MNLSQIAESLGVSPASISIVRAGRPGVSPLVRRKIQAALEENGFRYQEYKQPDFFASARPKEGESQRFIQLLKYRRSSLLVDKNEGFVDAVIDAIDERAGSEHYGLLLKSVSHQEYPDFLDTVDHQQFAGLLVIATEMERADICALKKLDLPIVILDSDHPGLPFSTVTMNNRDLAYEAVSYLFHLGCAQVGYICSSIRTGNFVGRANGYREGVEAHGGAWQDALVFHLTPSLQGSYEDMKKHMAQGRRVPPALFADNDVLAIGAMRALKEAGYAVGGDVRMIGVDNTPLSQLVSPALSTMQISRASLGQEAFSELLRQIEAPAIAPRHIRLGSKLIRRETA